MRDLLHGLRRIARVFAKAARNESAAQCKLAVEGLETRTLPAANFASGQVLVQFQANADQTSQDEVLALVSGTVQETIRSGKDTARTEGDLVLVALPDSVSVEEAISRLSGHTAVTFAEANFIYTTMEVSNDPQFTSGSMYGMYGDQSTPANQFGSQAAEAWAAGNVGSSSLAVGIVDEGIDINHPDLIDNIWTNPGETADNGVDDDGNGFIDDIHGWDFANNNNSVFDGTQGSTVDRHGTHVAGTIGAIGGNGIGVAGVAWGVDLISAKFLGPSGGTLTNAIKALDYLTKLRTQYGVNVVASNNSWGGGGFSQGLLDAITRSANAGILFVAAAGNSTQNNDATPSYPSNYNTAGSAGYDNVIAVAAIGSNGSLASFSSYGSTTVDLGAPGVGIVSTLPFNSYGSLSGTSMATPHVTGAAVLYAAANPGATAGQIRTALLDGATATPTTSLTGKVATGGRLNIGDTGSPPPPAQPSISIGDVTQSEGNSGNTAFTFTITLSEASAQAISVNFATANSTATSGSDYTATTGTVNFAAGETSKTVTVQVLGDTSFEANETFAVNLSNATNATIADNQGVGTITNDDAAPLPSIQVNSVSQNEGNSGQRNFTFTLSLSEASSQTVSVQFTTRNGTAIAGSDYTGQSGTVSFSPGVTQRTITIKVRGDRVREPNETFFLDLFSPVNATLGTSTGTGTIVNDD